MDIESEKRKLRFLSKVKIERSGCWIWQGSFVINKALEYGQFYWGKVNGKEKAVSAHRASYQILVKPIDDGMHILHKCHNSKCVNPEHLYEGTHLRNMRDRDESGRTSKAEHRYNFKRDAHLLSEVNRLRALNMTVNQVCAELDIGRSTFYRIRKMAGFDSKAHTKAKWEALSKSATANWAAKRA